MQTVHKKWNTETGLAICVLAMLAAALPPYVVAQEQGIDVTLLGTGDPVPRVDRFGAAFEIDWLMMASRFAGSRAPGSTAR